MRLIDADAAKEKLCTMCRWDGTSNCDECEHPIDDVPSIDAVKHGIWIEENTRTRSSKFYCSVCHRTAYDPQPTRIAGWVKRCRYAYCPNCGADMRGEQDE